MDENDKKKLKIGLGIAAFAVLLYLGLQNIRSLLQLAAAVLKLFSPFIYGACFAFVLNILMHFFEQKLFFRLNQKDPPRWKKLRRPVCMALTLLVFFGILAAIFSFIIPQLAASLSTMGDNLNHYAATLSSWASRTLSRFGIAADFNEALSGLIAEFSDSIITFIRNFMPRILGTAVGITSGVVRIFIGFVVSLYMLATKEQLTRAGRRITYAYLPGKAADYLSHIYRVVNRRFAGFVSGQLTEACILGLLCFFGMNIVGWGDYALLISVIIGLTNLVPIVGPIVGTIPGALIILVTNSPIQALLFVAFVIVLQQIDTHLIYPHVVGDSIGLPGLLVMFAVIIGGGVFGLPGILLGVPAFSVIYTLLSESVTKRLKVKSIRIKE